MDRRVCRLRWDEVLDLKPTSADGGFPNLSALSDPSSLQRLGSGGLFDAVCLSSAIGAVYAVMNRRAGLDNLVENSDRLLDLCRLLATKHSMVTRLVWETLSVMCIYSEGGE